MGRIFGFLQQVSFLLWRRSIVSPMLGQRAEELNQLRDPIQEFNFVAYLQEVLSQYMVSFAKISLRANHWISFHSYKLRYC